jgi:hypothetical protein
MRESGITGERAGASCGRRGEGKGNPRFKAALESIRNLKHNELAALPGQTGMDRDDRPGVSRTASWKDCAELLKAMSVLAVKHPERARVV